jgi:serine/threonine protein kinase
MTTVIHLLLIILQVNILIDDEGNPRICDFGLARIVREEDRSATGMTTTTEHTGTERYLAPELVTNDWAIPTTASDVYAIGCLGLQVDQLSATSFIFLTSHLVYILRDTIHAPFRQSPWQHHSGHSRRSSPGHALDGYRLLGLHMGFDRVLLASISYQAPFCFQSTTGS